MTSYNMYVARIAITACFNFLYECLYHNPSISPPSWLSSVMNSALAAPLRILHPSFPGLLATGLGCSLGVCG